MAKYMTEQRRKLISFLREHPDRRFSAREIAGQLNEAQISVSAVYRNLSALEEEGYITRVIGIKRREAYYQCLETNLFRENLHLVCTKCGKTFHLNRDETNRMLNEMVKLNGFKINVSKTVIYGLCRRCLYENGD